MADRLNSNAARFRATKHSRKRSCTSKIIYSRVQGIGRDKRRPSGPVARSTSRRCDEWPELHERHRTRRSQLVGAPAPKDRRSASGQPRRPMPRLVRREARAVRRGSRRLWSGGTLTPKGRAAGVFLMFGVLEQCARLGGEDATPRYTDLDREDRAPPHAGWRSARRDSGLVSGASDAFVVHVARRAAQGA
jgi:hypothetical protein